MELTITFPHPAAILGQNGSLPTEPRAASARNRARIGEKIKTREHARKLATLALKTVPQRNFPAKQLTVIWYFFGCVKPDVDGIVSKIKPLLDGCALAFGINDRDIELAAVHRVHSKEKNKTCELVFNTETL